jgi:hypothetical protein
MGAALLDTFKMEDSLNLPFIELLWRADECAERRAEMMGWRVSEVIPANVALTGKHGDTRYYEFEIWGEEL